MSELILEIVEGPEAGRQVPLSAALEAGRSADAGLTLDDDQASRHHARIEPSGGGAVVSDLDSKNGTYVNEQPLSGRREIRPGDRVRIGLSVLELRTKGEVAAQPSAVRPLPPFAPPGAGALGPAAAASDAAPVGDDYAALAALVDTNVKRQTGIAVFALLSLAGLAVLIYFGVT